MNGRAPDAASVRRIVERPGFDEDYLQKVRSATVRLSVHPVADGDVRAAAEVLRRHVGIDGSPPVVSSRVAGIYAKKAIGKAVGWYVRFVAGQVTALGGATVSFGVAVAERLERLEAENAELSRRITRLEAAVAGEDAAPRT